MRVVGGNPTNGNAKFTDRMLDQQSRDSLKKSLCRAIGRFPTRRKEKDVLGCRVLFPSLGKGFNSIRPSPHSGLLTL